MLPIKMVTSAYVNFKEDGVTQFVEPQRYKGTGVYNEDNTLQYNQFDNTYNKDWVQFKLSKKHRRESLYHPFPDRLQERRLFK